MIAHAITYARRTTLLALGARRKPRRRPLPGQRQPNAIRLAYFHALRPVLSRARELVDEKLVPRLPALVARAGVVHDSALADAGEDDYPAELASIVDSLAEEYFAEFPTERLTRLAAHFGERVSDQQRVELGKQLKSGLGVDLWREPDLTPRLNAWAQANAQLIKSVPQRYFGEIKTMTVQALRQGQRAEDLAALLEDRYSVSESRAQLIARDQIGKLNGELNMARQTDLGVERFTWRTSEDERVRPEHESLDGESFDWDDPPDEGIPGSPINCRCTAEPDLSDLIGSAAA